jgi:hypothetical protein
MIRPPEIVTALVEIVSEKLGREAIFRKVNNREEYFILDLAFSYFQKADRNKRNDYRSGYLYIANGEKKRLLFALAHTPVMSSFFKRNFDYERFRAIAEDTAKYRDENYLRFSRKGVQEEIRTPDLGVFLGKLDILETSGFAKLVFSKSKIGKTGAGNLFGLCLASGCDEEGIVEAVKKSWDLFLWLYPTRPVFKRNASLNRSMQRIENTGCEIRRVKALPKSILETPCSGRVEGAHILPHKDGGCDKLQNGVWLCSVHHRLTEGRLAGSRGVDWFEVAYAG